MDLIPSPGSVGRVNYGLWLLFGGHGVGSRIEDGVLVFPAAGLWANGEVFRRRERFLTRLTREALAPLSRRVTKWLGSSTVQLDVRLGVEPGRTLVESVGGFGRTESEAVSSAFEAFAAGSFHVLLSAVFGLPECHGTEVLEWTVGGRPRVVHRGPVTSRLALPLAPDGTPDLRFATEFERQVCDQPLPGGTHWVRLYQARMNGQVVMNEVLLDNEPWDEMQARMAAFDWPVCDGWYDVRTFLVIRDPV